MKLMTHKLEQTLMPADSESNRRQRPRMGGQFGLTFSGVDEGKIVMGDGYVHDLSQEGIGVRGNRLPKPGMELALFLELPDTNDTLCIPQTYVSWNNDRRFRVELHTARDKEPLGLECLVGHS